VTEKITGSANSTDDAIKKERDAFDTLFDHAPDKLELVKKSLLTFMRKHLDKLKIEINDLDSQVLKLLITNF
jgi:hypothetical protein